jgi:hypothetical protein
MSAPRPRVASRRIGEQKTTRRSEHPSFQSENMDNFGSSTSDQKGIHREYKRTERGVTITRENILLVKTKNSVEESGNLGNGGESKAKRSGPIDGTTPATRRKEKEQVEGPYCSLQGELRYAETDPTCYLFVHQYLGILKHR